MLTKRLGILRVNYELENGPKSSMYQVVAWEGYGVVCPGKFATNGSANLLAGRLVDLWEKYDCRWLSSQIPGPAAGKEAFAQAMRDACAAIRTDPTPQLEE